MRDTSFPKKKSPTSFQCQHPIKYQPFTIMVHIFLSSILLSLALALTRASVEWSLVRPAIVDDKAVLPCPEDYSPCYCGDYPSFGLYVVCELVTIDAIVSVFNRTSDSDIFWLQLRPLPDLERRGVTLPADLLSGKRARAIDLYCPSVVTGNLYSLTIDPNALTSSGDLIEYFYILGCDLGQQADFHFLAGFNKLMNLYMYGSTNIQGFQNLPALPSMGTLSINQCTGLDSIEFPAQSLPKLQQVYMTDNQIDDQTAGRLLTSIVSSSSVDTVVVLSLAYNLLTQIPAQILSFTKLNDLSLSGNDVPLVSSASLALPATRMERLAMANVSLNVIEPGALRANIVLADLTRNNLTQFESAVFQTMLQGMITLNGSLSIDSNPFECDCSLAWLIRDSRNLLPVVHGAQCSNSTRFEQLDPGGFSQCVVAQQLH